MRKTIFALTVLAALTFCGCGNPQGKLDAAKAAENSGDHRQATNLYAALALKLSPALKLHEAQKGKMLPPERWIGEVEKYLAWLTEKTEPRHSAFRTALDGLIQAKGKFDQDNTANIATQRTLDTLSVFTAQWNNAFNPPPSGGPDAWNAVIKSAAGGNFSILRLASPKNYVYEVNIVSRKNARRVHFTLYSESQVFVPLPPGDYVAIIKSSVDFQKDKQWFSDFSAFSITAPETPALITMDMRTRVARRGE